MTGGEVAIPTPGWPNYRNQAVLVGGTPVEVPLNPEQGFSRDPERLIGAMTDHTEAVVLTTPSNPTRRVFDPASASEIVQAADERDAYVITDEVYSRLLYAEYATGIKGYDNHPDRVLTVESCSKTYAMTGWRVGWFLGPPSVVNAATIVRESTRSCTSSVSQHAGVATLTGSSDDIDGMRSTFTDRRDYVVERIDAMDGGGALLPRARSTRSLTSRESAGRALNPLRRSWMTTGW